MRLLVVKITNSFKGSKIIFQFDVRKLKTLNFLNPRIIRIFDNSVDGIYSLVLCNP